MFTHKASFLFGVALIAAAVTPPVKPTSGTRKPLLLSTSRLKCRPAVTTATWSPCSQGQMCWCWWIPFRTGWAFPQ